MLVHDAARPFCPPGVIDRLLAPLEFFDGAAPVLAVGDTLARAGSELLEPVDRDGMVRVQTPQAFRLASLTAAYDRWAGPTADRRDDACFAPPGCGSRRSRAIRRWRS